MLCEIFYASPKPGSERTVGGEVFLVACMRQLRLVVAAAGCYERCHGRRGVGFVWSRRVQRQTNDARICCVPVCAGRIVGLVVVLAPCCHVCLLRWGFGAAGRCSGSAKNNLYVLSVCALLVMPPGVEYAHVGSVVMPWSVCRHPMVTWGRAIVVCATIYLGWSSPRRPSSILPRGSSHTSWILVLLLRLESSSPRSQGVAAIALS